LRMARPAEGWFFPSADTLIAADGHRPELRPGI
jgi:hypothetical protein